jgi:hypothetical protein
MRKGLAFALLISCCLLLAGRANAAQECETMAIRDAKGAVHNSVMCKRPDGTWYTIDQASGATNVTASPSIQARTPGASFIFESGDIVVFLRNCASNNGDFGDNAIEIIQKPKTPQLKTDPNGQIFRDIFRTEIFPKIRERCQYTNKGIKIFNYIADIYIDKSLKELPSPTEGEIPLNWFLVMPLGNTCCSFDVFFSGYRSLPHLRSARSQWIPEEESEIVSTLPPPAGNRPSPPESSRTLRPQPQKAANKPRTEQDDLKAIYAAQNIGNLNEAPLWFTRTANGPLFVAVKNIQTGKFRIERFDAEAIQRDIDSQLPPNLEQPQTPEEQRVSDARLKALVASLSKKYPIYSLLAQYYRSDFNLYRVRQPLNSVKTLDELRREHEDQTRGWANAARLDARKMRNASIMQLLYFGQFEKLISNYVAYLAVEQYIKAYSNLCREYLPPDKVEIQLRITEYLEKKIGGAVIDSRIIDDRIVKTGIFTTTTFARALKTLEFTMIGPVLLSGSLLTLRDRVGATSASFYYDMKILLQRHGCDTPTHAQFADNLLKFVNETELNLSRKLGVGGIDLELAK